MSLLLWMSPLLVPLLSAALVTARPGPRTSRWLVLAPLPAGVLAAVGPVVPAPSLPWLLLDVHLALDGVGRVLLGLTALAWAAAGAYSRAEAERQGGYATWWSLSLTGNVGVILADDVLTFYTAFVLMTLAAYGLVVHSRRPAARRAGRTYLVLGVVGETLLLGGLLLAVADAAGPRLHEVAAAAAGSPQRGLIIAALVAGCGIKAGLIGLHVWLPLAHPAAPFPASAVLSGAMIKAGLVGWLRLLPVGELAVPAWSTSLVALGLVGAFLGVLLGLTHTAPKVLLAYSSVSQMGFVTLLVGVALATPSVASVAAAAAAAYALHHGLAKAALFLAVGLLSRAREGWARTGVLAGAVIAGASLAGVPLSSGAYAKAWMKEAIERAGLGGWVVTATALAATGTTVLMIRLFVLLRRQSPEPAAPPLHLGPALVLTVAVLTLTPLVVPRLLPELALPRLGSVVVDALWPTLFGLVVAAGAATIGRRTTASLPSVPAGDLVVVEERAVAWLGRLAVGAAAPVSGALAAASVASRDALVALARHGPVIDRIEDRLTRWSTGGAMVGLVGLALVLTFATSNS